MSIFEKRRDDFVVTTDKSRLDVPLIFDFLANRSYWAKGRTLEMTVRSIENSLCFGLYHQAKQVGFSRVVTDYATFGWICDVFILEDYRKGALGKWLVQCMMEHPELARVRRLLLATLDAHELYRKYGGFSALPEPERWMTRLLEQKQ